MNITAFAALSTARFTSLRTLGAQKSISFRFQNARTCVSQPKRRIECSSTLTLAGAEEVLRIAADETGLTHVQVRSLMQLCDLLVEENSKYNLSGIRKREDILVKHFVDALSLISIIDSESPTKVIDVGTGAGFPGLVLAIARPDLHVTLLDSVRKKTKFHYLATDALQLKNVDSVWMRAEEAGQDVRHREKYDMGVARSVAELRVLAELCLPLVSCRGCFLAQKSVDPEQTEIQAAQKAIEILGGCFEKVSRQWDNVTLMQEIGLKDDTGRENCTVVVRKTETTPSKYPRRPGLPSKLPL